MPKVAVYNMQGSQVDEIQLNDEIFNAGFNEAAVHNAIIMQLASRRQGTHSVKTRAEVRGGGRKPWRQKGTGRARVGSIRSPLWRTGGIIFGPKPRNYSYSLPKKARRVALKSALSLKVEKGNMVIVDSLSFKEPKTKEMLNVLKALQVDQKALVVTAEVDVNVYKSAGNITGVMPMAASDINVYDLMNHDKLVITKDAVAKVEEVLA
jgi:large subunit ribosomal protein L4